MSTSEKPPQRKESYWLCPQCNWMNPYTTEKLQTPKTKTWTCLNCTYTYYDEDIEKFSGRDKFTLKYPQGKQSNTQTRNGPLKCRLSKVTCDKCQEEDVCHITRELYILQEHIEKIKQEVANI